MIRERVREWLRASLRSFVLGPGVVESADVGFGKDSSTFQPQEYGEYLATSNAIYSCANLRARMLASLPLKFYRKGREGREEVTGGPLVELVQRVNPFWTMGRLLRMTELSLCLWGEAFWFMERGKSGQLTPREIWWGRPDRVRVVPDAQKYVKGFVYRPANGEKDIVFSPDEVVWILYDNPIDEFEGLAPLAAARLAADTRSAALKSNRNLFRQGMQMGGLLMPRQGVEFSAEQAKELEAKLDQRFRGVDKAHRWGVFRTEVQLGQAGVTPKDAEFLGLLNVTLEDACRAYNMPLDLMGGRRTYENVRVSLVMLWDLCLLPEGRFIAEELVEKLLPMFPGEADEVEFDASNVALLQEDASEKWGREKGQIEVGALTINEWRAGRGMEPVGWGDEWWASMWVAPPGTVEVMGDDGAGERFGKSLYEGGGNGNLWRVLEAGIPVARAVEYDSAEHRFIWRRWVRRLESQERELGEAVAGLFARQRDSVLDRLAGRAARQVEASGRQTEEFVEAVIMEPFDLGRWRKEFRMEIRPLLEEIVRFHGLAALEDLGLMDAVFHSTLPEVVRFLEGRAQRFAEAVNETTWEMLRASLMEGMEEGEGIPELQERVEAVMAERIRSSKETIARTEVNGAANGGTLEAWRQSEVVEGKEWMSALIADRTRATHMEAHGQVVALDGNFEVGAGAGPHPGAIGLAEEDINCLCTMKAVVEEGASEQGANE
jgi:HK97 family phage portal protein